MEQISWHYARFNKLTNNGLLKLAFKVARTIEKNHKEAEELFKDVDLFYKNNRKSTPVKTTRLQKGERVEWNYLSWKVEHTPESVARLDRFNDLANYTSRLEGYLIGKIGGAGKDKHSIYTILLERGIDIDKGLPEFDVNGKRLKFKLPAYSGTVTEKNHLHHYLKDLVNGEKDSEENN